MSWKTERFLGQLRPMDGQQADRPETEPVERPTTETPMLPHRSQPKQQSLFPGVAQ